MDTHGNWEGQVVPFGTDLLGFCTDCFRVRWLGVVDHMGEGQVPHGTCRQCVREATEGE
jgi:hypothetical protein